MEPKAGTAEPPALPRRKTVTPRGILPPAVMPVAVGGNGPDVSCSVTHKGKAVKESRREGMPAAGGCVAVPPAAG
ncbi:hypothetical protein [Streptomyces sp. NPDC048295]|uniref:hypothetical protein n=1 Tax=Streptomyces sp. NPDC048295 TaxID=3154617 RepID=UPI00343BC68A